MRKKRILFGSTYGINDTTSWLRAFGPFSLKPLCDEVEIVLPQNFRNEKGEIIPWWIDWPNWMNIDCCFLHRPNGKVGASIIHHAKVHGVPIWVDHDDDLLNIPESNPHYKTHHDAEQEYPCIEFSYKNCEIVTCSGKVMYDDIRTNFNSNVIHISTGLDDRLVRFKRPFGHNRKIAWRGSKSHLSDLRAYELQIKRLMQKYCDYEWGFFGVNPQEELGWDVEGVYSPPRNLFPFIMDLCEFNASLHWVVLEDNRFNRVKSNLAWLDATLAGSAVLAPRFEEWRHDGPIPYGYFAETTEITFEHEFEHVLNPKSCDLKKCHEISWRYIQENLLTSKLNEKRREIVRNL